MYTTIHMPITQKPPKFIDCKLKYIYLAYHTSDHHFHSQAHGQSPSRFSKTKSQLQSLARWDLNINESKNHNDNNVWCFQSMLPSIRYKI